VVRALDLGSVGRGFDSRPPHFRVQPWASCSHARVRQQLAAYHSGWNAGLGRQTFPILRQTASWMGDHCVGKPSAIGQPTWPTQPSVPQGSVNK